MHWKQALSPETGVSLAAKELENGDGNREGRLEISPEGLPACRLE